MRKYEYIKIFERVGKYNTHESIKNIQGTRTSLKVYLFNSRWRLKIPNDVWRYIFETVLSTNVSDVECNHSNTFKIESLTINNNPEVKNE